MSNSNDSDSSASFVRLYRPSQLNSPVMMLDPVDASRKSGDEPFHRNGEPHEFEILDFWQWSASNLLNNTQRGILAEHLVAEATGSDQGVRSNWENFDLETSEGIRLEVKSSAYIQSWEQSSYSDVSFDIGASQDVCAETSEKDRRSDVYVFCLLDHKNQQTIDPTDLSQWTFYVIATELLDEARPGQKSIVPNQLEKVGARTVPYVELGAVVRKVSDAIESE